MNEKTRTYFYGISENLKFGDIKKVTHRTTH